FFTGMYVVMAYYYMQQDIRIDEAHEAALVEEGLNELIAQRTQVLLAVSQLLKQNAVLQKALLSRDRARLYAESQPILNELVSSYRITHFYFHTPDGVNFLRVHFPSRHGDRINRHTLLAALSSGRYAAGMELGPLGTFTLRVVVPWIVDEQTLGFIELGEEVDHLLGEVQRRTRANLVVLLDKQYLQEENWQQGLDMLHRQGAWEQFPGEVIADVIFPSWENEQVMASLRTLTKADNLLTLQQGDRQFRGARLPLLDVSGTIVGHLLVFHEITAKLSHYYGLVLWTALVSVVSGGGLFLVSFVVLGRADRQLASSHQSLTTELSRRVQAEEELRQSHALLEARVLERTSALERERSFLQRLIDGLPDPVMVIDLDYRIKCMNQVARDLQPVASADSDLLLCHRISHRLDHPCGQQDQSCPLQLVRETGQPVTVLHQHLDADQDLRICQVSASPLYDQDGSLIGIIESSRDVTELLDTQEALASNREMILHMVGHDPLTELPNRSYCLDRLPHSLLRAGQNQEKVAVLFIDLDRFKNINDTLGHHAGDLILQGVARRLKNGTRPGDFLARFGGDEFVLILQNITEPTQVIRLIHRLLAELDEGFEVQGHTLHVTVSIGISFFPNDATTIEELIKLAEIAMYRAKEEGRNVCQFYTPDMDDRAREFLTLENELRLALEREQLVLHYQPQVDLSSGRLVGFEALIRWQHPQRGLLAPGSFIPLAEETGLILGIGKWVLREACRQNLEWQRRGYPSIPIAVNISARQFMQGNLVGEIYQLMRPGDLRPDCLALELTESLIMGNVKLAVETMHQIRGMGIQLAIDDFGSGYSSLSYLKNFPIGKLKIDRSFVMDITNNLNDAAIACSIIALGQSMGL
ncbi:MAG: EAL domain-containing protein, partial [Desulfuromonadaceae bacterium]